MKKESSEHLDRLLGSQGKDLIWDSFESVLEAIKRNDSGLISLNPWQIQNISTLNPDTGSKFTNHQIEQVALAILLNTHLENIKFIGNLCDAPDEIRPYLELIHKTLLRNKTLRQQEQSRLLDYLKLDLANFIILPLIVMGELGEYVFSKTLGFEPLIELTKSGPVFYDFKLPTISLKGNLLDNISLYRSGNTSVYPSVGLRSIRYRGSLLSLLFVPANYFFRILGKFVGFALTIPFLPLLVIAAFGISIISKIRTESNLTGVLATTEKHIQNNLETILADNNNENYHNYERGEMYRDRQDFDKAFEAFSNVPSSDKNYMDAMYEAGCIARDNQKNIAAAISAFEKGLGAAKTKNNQEMQELFSEMLLVLQTNPDDNIEFNDNRTLHIVPGTEEPAVWEKGPPATNYGTLRDQVRATEQSQDDVANPLSQYTARYIHLLR